VSLKNLGFNDAEINESRPPINARNLEAVEVYKAMGGWHPERLPVIFAFVEIAHLDGLWERLVAIRDHLLSTDDV